MATDKPSEKKLTEYNFKESISEILEGLAQIQKNIPNGEIKLIQGKLIEIEESYNELYTEVKDMKKRILDPETGIVVQLNKNTATITKYEDFREKVGILATVAEILAWKNNINKVVWILFAALAGIILNIIFKQ